MKLLVVAKQAGVPFAGEIVEAYNYAMSLPLISAVLIFILGGSNRHAYKIAAAQNHPPLRDYWNPQIEKRCQKPIPVPAPNGDDVKPFPYTKSGVRGTPQHTPFTDFENAIFANERGSLFDQVINGGSRGFHLRFKTGNKTNAGARDLFHIERISPSIVFCMTECFKLIFCFLCSFCGCSGSKGEATASDSVKVESDDRSKVLGYVRKTKQLVKGCYGDAYANRFNKRAKPIYDIIDADENILYTVYVPIRGYVFGKSIPGLSCFLKTVFGAEYTAYADMDYLAIVKGARPTEKEDKEYRHCNTFKADVGWNIMLTPKNEKFIDTCLGSTKSCLKWLCIPDAIFDVISAMASLIRTIPIDNWTQVPHPGKNFLRGALPCTHGMSASRTFFPPGIPMEHRALITAFTIKADIEKIHMTLGDNVAEDEEVEFGHGAVLGDVELGAAKVVEDVSPS